MTNLLDSSRILECLIHPWLLDRNSLASNQLLLCAFTVNLYVVRVKEPEWPLIPRKQRTHIILLVIRTLTRRFDSDNAAILLQRAVNLYSVYALLGEMLAVNETLITHRAAREDIYPGRESLSPTRLAISREYLTRAAITFLGFIRRACLPRVSQFC